MSDELSPLLGGMNLQAEFRRTVALAPPQDRQQFHSAIQGLVRRLGHGSDNAMGVAHVRAASDLEKRPDAADSQQQSQRISRIDAEISALIKNGVDLSRGRDLIQVASDGLGLIRDNLERMQVLAEEAAREDTGEDRRAELDDRFTSLEAQVDRIASQSERHERTPLDSGGAGETRLSLSVARGDAQAVELVIEDATASALGISGLSLATQGDASSALSAVESAVEGVEARESSVNAQSRRLSVIQRVSNMEHDLLASARRAAGTPAIDGAHAHRLDELIMALEERVKQRHSSAELSGPAAVPSDGGQGSGGLALGLLSSAVAESLQRSDAQAEAMEGAREARIDQARAQRDAERSELLAGGGSTRKLLTDHADLTLLFDSDDTLRPTLQASLATEEGRAPPRDRQGLRELLATSVASQLGDAGKATGPLSAETLSDREGLLKLLAANPGNLRSKIAEDQELASQIADRGSGAGELRGQMRAQLASDALDRVHSRLGPDSAISRSFLEARPALAASLLLDPGRIPSMTEAEAETTGSEAYTDADLVRDAEANAPLVLSQVVGAAREILDRPGVFSQERLSKDEDLAAMVVASEVSDEAPRFVDFLRGYMFPPSDQIEAEALIEAFQVYRVARQMEPAPQTGLSNTLFQRESGLREAFQDREDLRESVAKDDAALKRAFMAPEQAARQLSQGGGSGALSDLLRQRDGLASPIFASSEAGG